MAAAMYTAKEIDWSQGEHRGKVRLPEGHSLYLIASGPARSGHETPAVVIEHGMGGAASEWVKVQRLVARFARVYVYERAGYHHSDPPTKAPTAQNIAADLRSLLSTAGVEPPYLLVGHSYGGILIRQFLADYSRDVFGMVVVDSAPVVNEVPPSWSTLLGDSTYEEIVGLNANRAVSDEEYQTIRHESDINEREGGIAEQEYKLRYESSKPLKDRLDGRQALGNGRLSVIFCDESNDFGKVYKHGVEHGNGTEEAREALRKRLEGMSEIDEAAMREHLVLSSDSRFVKAEGKRKTHNVQLVDPEFVAREIEWVYGGQKSA